MAAALGLVAFVALRFVSSARHKLEVFNSEELLNLRLRWVLEANEEIWTLNQLWVGNPLYGSGGGPVGLSFLQVGLGWTGMGAYWSLRVAAIIFAVMLALGTAVIARKLLGRWGPASALLGLCLLPPPFLQDSLTSRGNYVEATSLTVAGVALWLVASELVGARGVLAHFAAALAFGLAAWFTPAFLPVGLIFLVAQATTSGLRGLLAIVGAAVPIVLLLMWGAEASSGTVRTVRQHPVDAARALLQQPELWTPTLTAAYRALPTEFPGTVDSGDAEEAGTAPPDGRGEMRRQARLHGYARSACWLLVALLGLRLLVGARRRPVVITLAAGLLCAGAALAPAGLSLVGMAPNDVDSLGGPRAHFWDARRAFIIWPAVALGFSAVVVQAAGRGWLRPIRLAAGLGVMVPSVLLVASGLQTFDDVGPRFRPERWAICPAKPLIYLGDPCAGPIVGLEIRPLEALVDATAHWEIPERAAVLLGHGSVKLAPRGCLFAQPEGFPDVSIGGAPPPVDHLLRAYWLGVGAAANAHCAREYIGGTCAKASTSALRSACLEARAGGPMEARVRR